MKELLFKRKNKFLLYFLACFFPVINDLIRIGVFTLIFRSIEVKEKEYFFQVLIITAISIPLTFFIYLTSRMLRISYMRDTILDVRINAFDKIMNTSFKEFSKKSKDVYISNLINDINNFESNFFINLLNFIYRGGIYTVSLIIILFLDYKLGIALFLVSVVLFFIVRTWENKTNKLQKSVSTNNEELTLNISNVFNGLEILKLNNIEDKFIHKSFDEINKVEKSKFKFRFFTETQRNLTNSIGYLTFVVVLIYLLSQVKNGLSYGMIMLLVQLSNNISFALPDIFPRLNVIKSSRDIYNKITTVEEEKSISYRYNRFKFTKAIEVNDLSFNYEDKEILNHASFVIEKGKKYLIKGPSGVGKSTLVKLLSMIHENYHGSIKVDNVDYKTIIPKSFNEKVAYIYQDVFLFEDSIKNNITLFKELDEKQIKVAIEKAGLSDFIKEKPNGLFETISENGKNLSGGERQRISIARAIAKSSEILFIDEGTSALNEELGREIEKTFLSLDSTVISISHRYYKDVTDNYDYVLELKDGKVNTYNAKDYFIEEEKYA